MNDITKQPESAKGAIALALVAAISGWGTSAITNWDKLVGTKPPEVSPATPASSGQQPSASGAPVFQPRPANVLFVDTFASHKAYSPEIQNAGISNAHFFEKKMRSYSDLQTSIEPHVAITAQNGTIDVNPIIRMNPDVIVVHRSAFNSKDDQANDERLQHFLREMRVSNATFLIYSRQADTGEAALKFFENQTELAGRIFMYRFTMGNPLADEVQVRHFLNYVATLAKSKLYDEAISKVPQRNKK